MSITTQCPECESRFHLQPDLLGKGMRCPNCQHVFLVETIDSDPPASTPEDSAPDPPAPGPTRSGSRVDTPPVPYESGSVADFLPIAEAYVEAESTDASTPTDVTSPAPPREIHWSEVAEQSTEPTPPPKEIHWSEGGETPSEPNAASREITWSAAVEPPLPETSPTPETSQPSDATNTGVLTPTFSEETMASRPGQRRRSLGKAAFWGMTLLVAAAIGLGGYQGYRYWAATESRLAAEADALYEAGKYQDAREQYTSLIEAFPESPDLQKYTFFRDLTPLRERVSSVVNPSDPQPAVELLDGFLAEHADSPLLAPDQFALDLTDTLKQLGEHVVGKAEQALNRASEAQEQANPGALEEPLTESQQWLLKAAKLDDLVRNYLPEDASPAEFASQIVRFQERLNQIHRLEARFQELAKITTEPTQENRERFRFLVSKEGLADHPRTIDLLTKMDEILRQRVQYVRDQQPMAPLSTLDPVVPGLLFAGVLDRADPTATPSPTPEVVFALARGLLYVLDGDTGAVRWATRVGIDAQTLPLRVPEDESNPDLVLVASNDGNQFALTAHDTLNGAIRWRQALDGPCLGSPVVIDTRVFVAQADAQGTLAEYDLVEGVRRATLRLQQPIGAPMAWEPGTSKLYLPAMGRNVYLLDVDRRDQQGIPLKPEPVVLGTQHTPGSLQAAPVILDPFPRSQQRYLVLTEAAGIDRLRLRGYALPSDFPTGIVTLQPLVEHTLGGLSRFAPRHDYERLAMVSDRGLFALFGIQQRQNDDSILFPFLNKPFALAREHSLPASAEIVSMDGNRFWVLADGQLQRLDLQFDTRAGLKLQVEPPSLPLGIPLQPSQQSRRNDRLYLVTQNPANTACVATAVDRHSGAVRWQRQLGMVVANSPVRLGDATILLDQSGGLYRIPPIEDFEPTVSEWRIDPNWEVAPPLANLDANHLRLLLKDPRHELVHALSVSRDGKRYRMLIRTLDARGRIRRRSVALPQALAGEPVVFGDGLLFPLANGSLYRLTENGQLEEGPIWRSGDAPVQARGSLAPLTEELFLCSDGLDRLTIRRWPAGNLGFSVFQQVKTRYELARPIKTLPGEDVLRCVLATTNQEVRLLAANQPERPERIWNTRLYPSIPPGPITAGPYVHTRQGQQNQGYWISYMVDQRHLIWLDPEQDSPLWVYTLPEGQTLVGDPMVADGQVWVMTQSGKYYRLGLRSGQAQSKARQLPAGLQPAAGMVAFQEDRLLVPLTDGTVLLPRRAPPTASVRIPVPGRLGSGVAIPLPATVIHPAAPGS